MKPKLVCAVFALSLLSVSANAAVTMDMAAITCRQYRALPPEMSRHFSAWMTGWYSYQTRRTYVDLLALQKNIEKLKSWCRFNSDETVMKALETSIGPQ